MVNNLKIGDKVCTTSGIFGVIREINSKENQVEVEISKDVVVKVLRTSIGEVISAKEDNDIKKSKK
jgi:preprotein translocase subunit YajC